MEKSEAPTSLVGMSSADVINMVYELKEVSVFLEDPQVDRALDQLIRILFNKADIPLERIPPLIVELQALATKFAISATYYQTIGKDSTRESNKKNIYYTLRDAFTKLADNLKYLVR